MDAATKADNSLESAMKNMKIDPPAKGTDFNLSGPKDASPSDAASCISSVDGRSSIKENEVHQEELMVDQSMQNYEYYYPGANCLFGDWGGQTYAFATDGLEIHHPVIPAENGSILYHVPGLQAGYNTYNPLLVGATIGYDGQLLVQPSYYPSEISPQPFVSAGAFPQAFTYTPELVPVYHWDPSSFLQYGLQGTTLSTDPTDLHFGSNYSSQRHNLTSKNSSAAKAASEVKALSPASVLPQSPAVQNQTNKPPNKLPLLSNEGKKKMLHSNRPSTLNENRQISDGGEKLKPRNKLNGHDNFNLLNEQNCSPVTNASNVNCKTGSNLTEAANSERNKSNSGLAAIVKEDYNLPGFSTKYEQAFFFVIKSYTEDDVHKSIKYKVWSSTPNGNKRLDNAFQVSQEKIAETGSKCPVFLFFSVNASGQFCGLAEMIGRVDFSKNMDFWQQDKWNGVFPVKWHIVKDIPNPQFRHIILENNENKPVTNSRDTQEVMFPQGIEMLHIFKNYNLKTSILDDFGFYEERQRTMLDKRSKQTPKMLHPMVKKNEFTQDPKQGDVNLKASEIETVGILTGETAKELQSEIAAA